jgi:hypothetical protein
MMSNALAIAAVTATLRNLLENVNQGTGLNGSNVAITTKPPDKARDGTSTDNQINLFLYQVLPNAAWRNMDIPQSVRSGETAIPPLALNLYYMLTAYGEGDDDSLGHRLLGHAMSIFYDHPLLGAQEIKDALPPEIDSDLENQIERVRITLQPLTVEEIFRLWSGFLTQYRISVSYEICVVLIESTRAVRTPLPVLTRGKDDRGVKSQASMLPPFTTLTKLTLPTIIQSAIQVGERLTIEGFHLDAKNTQILLTQTRFGFTWQLAPEAGITAQKMTVTIPATPPAIQPPDPTAPTTWPVGFYSVSLRFTNDDGFTTTSNELPLALAPTISNIQLQGDKTDATIALDCNPGVLPGQRVALLIGDREVPFAFPPPPSSPPQSPQAITSLSFHVGAIDSGTYFVRLRVDGVDSLLIKQDPQTNLPAFDKNQRVIIP